MALSSPEIRALKLKKYEVEYERKRDIFKWTMWFLLPFVIAGVVENREAIGSLIAQPFVFFITLSTPFWKPLIFLTLVAFIFAMIPIGTFIGMKIADVFERRSHKLFKEYSDKIDDLIVEAENDLDLRETKKR